MNQHRTLTEDLKEHAMSCRGRAERARQDGDKNAAAKWLERAKHAEEGFALADHTDLGYMRDHQKLMARAATEHRMRHKGLPERQTDRMDGRPTA